MSKVLLDDVCHATARRLLEATDLQEDGIAFLLGFEERSSFTRAFRDWEGMTPRRWRVCSGMHTLTRDMATISST